MYTIVNPIPTPGFRQYCTSQKNIKREKCVSVNIHTFCPKQKQEADKKQIWKLVSVKSN